LVEQEILLFNKWDLAGVEVRDVGLKSVISLKPSVIPHTHGRHEHKKFGKAEVNIVERLANSIMHFGKKHAKNTGRMGGKKQRSMNVVRAALEIVHLKAGENPVQVLVRAVENAAPNEDTTRISYGGVVYHLSVDVAPLRRVDLALRFIAEGVREASYSTQRSVEEVLADEIINAARGDANSFSVKKKTEQERIALSSR
jgi:small subunit ribosomal protein S7